MAFTIAEAFVSIKPEVDHAAINSEGTKAGSGFAGKMVAAVAAAGIGAAIGNAIATNMNIDAGLDKVQASMGLTVDEASRIGQMAGDTYKGAWGDSLEEVQQMYGDTMRAFPGISDEAMQQITEGAATAADVFDQDYNEVIRATQQLLTNGLAPDAESAMDMVSTAMRDSKGPIDEVLANITEYSSAYATLGLDGTNVIGGLTSEWATNQYAIDKTGDAMKELAIRAIDGSEGTADALSSIGLSAEEVNAAFAEGGPAAEEMTSKIISSITSIEDPAERSAAGVALMGAPFEDLGENAVPILNDVVDGIGDYAGATESIQTDAYSNAATDIESWKRRVETGFQSVIGKVLELPGPLGAGAGAMAGFASAAMPAMSSLGPLAMGIAGLQGPLGRMGTAIMGGVTSLGSMIASAARATVSVVASIGRQVAAWVVMGAQSLLAAGKVAAAWLIAMGPIALIVAAVVGLVAVIIANWDTIKVYLTAAWTFIKTTAETVWNAITAFFRETWEAIKTAVSTAIQAVRATISAVFNAIRAYITNVLNAYRVAFTTVWNGIKAAVTAVVNAIRSVITSVFNAVRNTISGVMNSIRSTVSAVWNGIRSAITGVVNGIRSTVSSVFNSIKSTMSSAASTARGLVTSAFNGMRNSVRTAINTLMSVVRGIPRRIMGALGNVGSMLTGAGRKIIQGLINGIRNMAGNVKSAVSGVLKKARNLLPFSPAKEGPFSGKGWTLYSGQAISESLAAGIDKSGVHAVRAAQGVAGDTNEALGGIGAGAINPSVRMPLRAEAGGRSVTTGDINIHIKSNTDLEDPNKRRKIAESIKGEIMRMERELV